MSQSTYAGVMRQVPIVPFPSAQGMNLLRGMVLEWDAGMQVAKFWGGVNLAFGVAVGDFDSDLVQVAVYCAKGASVLIRCAAGITPNPNDFLFYGGSPGLVSNVGTGQAFARAIGVGFNGFVEAIIV